MENKLDRFFKNKLSERPFAFQEAYWESALVEIRKRKAQRRRRFFLWFFTTLGAATGLVLLGWVGFRQSLEVPISFFPIYQQDDYRMADGPALEREESALLTNNQLSPAQEQPEISLHAPSPSPVAGPSALSASQGIENTLALSGLASAEPSNAFAQPLNHVTSQEAEAENSRLLPEVPKPIDPAGIRKQDAFSGALLPLLTPASRFLPAGGPANLRIAGGMPVENASSMPTIDKFVPKRISLWAGGGATFYPLPQEKGDFWTGIQAGMEIRYLLEEKIALWGGLGYFQRHSRFLPVDTSVQRSYSFGLDQSEFVLRPTVLHGARLYLGAQWEVKGNHHLEAGLAPSLVLGVQGRAEQRSYKAPWERTAEEQARQDVIVREYYENLPDSLALNPAGVAAPLFFSDPVVIQNGSLDVLDRLQTFQLEVTMGYEYRWNDWLRTGIRAHWRLSDFYKEHAGTEESFPVAVGLHLRARFK